MDWNECIGWPINVLNLCHLKNKISLSQRLRILILLTGRHICWQHNAVAVETWKSPFSQSNCFCYVHIPVDFWAAEKKKKPLKERAFTWCFSQNKKLRLNFSCIYIVFLKRYSSHALCKDKWSRIHTIQCLTRMSAWGLAPFSSLLPHLNRHQTCGFKFRKQPHVTSVLKSLHIHTLVGKRFVFRGFQMSNSNLFCRFGLMELDSYCFLFVFAFF